jgi:hypothetical protein
MYSYKGRGAWLGRGVVHPPLQSRSGSKLGSKMIILNEKFDFLLSTNFKLLSRI